MRSPLEVQFAVNEMQLGFLFASLADSAYDAGDIGCGDQARVKGQAAYVRADRLLAQVVAPNRALVCNLKSLHNALNG